MRENVREEKRFYRVCPRRGYFVIRVNREIQVSTDVDYIFLLSTKRFTKPAHTQKKSWINYCKDDCNIES